MKTNIFGKTGREITEIGLGTWQLGTVWGDPFNEVEAQKILEAAYETGINFIDIADIYNDGNSELAIAKIIKAHPDHFFVTTKCGRGLNPHTDEMYTPDAIEGFVDGSLKRMGLEKLDLIPYALRWVLMHDAVSVVIPGASKVEQVYSNVRAADMPALTQEQMDGVKAIYDKYIRESVHNNW